MYLLFIARHVLGAYSYSPFLYFIKFMVQLTWEGRTGAQQLFTFMQKEWVKYWRISLKLIAVDDTVKTYVLVFRDNNFSYGIQRQISNDHAYDKFSGKEEEK
jgi:hypothetical protein